MWYFDEFMASSELHTLLMSNFGGNDYSPGSALVGFVDKCPDVNVTHSWKEAGNSLSGTLVTGIQHIGKGLTDFGEKQGSDLANLITDDVGARTTSSLYNMKITNNASMLKEYDGTSSDITVPTFYKYYLCDKEGYSVRNNVINDLGKMQLLGSSDLTQVNITQMPPNSFKFGYTFDENLNVCGSYCLANAKFLLKNLLPTTINVEYSDVVIADTTEPVYAKLTIQFEYGRKPTQNDVINFLQNSSIGTGYTDAAKMIKSK